MTATEGQLATSVVAALALLVSGCTTADLAAGTKSAVCNPATPGLGLGGSGLTFNPVAAAVELAVMGGCLVKDAVAGP